ncbi:MAG TPA: glucoamylase family protein [bacterium]
MKKKYFSLLILLALISISFAQEDIIFFTDSPDGDQMYDSSWGYKNAPSYLELAGDKFPVDPQHPYQGAHSLRLHWTSKSGGDWGLTVASVGWPKWDFTQYDSILYWINGPAEIAQADLPDLALEDITKKKSTRVWLGHYFDGVDGDSTTWQKVMVPIDAFQPGGENCDFTKIQTIFHYQKVADEVEHIAWIDEIRIIKEGSIGPTPPATPENLTAKGADSRIDLKWEPNSEPDLLGYYVYRAPSTAGTFTKLNNIAHETHIYSDFFGENNKTYYYYITAVNVAYQESTPSDTMFSSSYQMNEEELLTSVQEATFRYFYDFGHPISGLTREVTTSGDVCTSGGTGFGLMTIMVGAERGFVSRDSAAARTLKMLTFLQDSCTRFHGAWSHWINGATGEAVPFSTYDDGGDLVETAYLIQGVLTIRNYYTLDNPVENEIRTRATEMWETVEWDWYRRFPNGLVLYWHWSLNHEWRMNMPVKGFNEAMIVYLLAIASPTHSVPANLYYNGWAGNPGYVNGNSYYGYKQWVGPPYGGPLFFTHYSFLGFDPRNKSDNFCNYFENNRNTSLIHRAYCTENPYHHAGYDSLVWGLTASYNPWGYRAHEPHNNDNGTITPTAAISAMPYTPQESIATLKHFYYKYGHRLWGEFGFRDAFNLDQDWFAKIYVAIDQGTIVPMIENYRTGLCWEKFMANPEIPQMLDAIGWTITDVNGKPGKIERRFELEQNYPNPFNAETVIRFSLAETQSVTFEIYNLLGQKVLSIHTDKKMMAGKHKMTIKADDLPSGIYLYRLQAGDYVKNKKMILIN